MSSPTVSPAAEELAAALLCEWPAMDEMAALWAGRIVDVLGYHREHPVTSPPRNDPESGVLACELRSRWPEMALMCKRVAHLTIDELGYRPKSGAAAAE